MQEDGPLVEVVSEREEAKSGSAVVEGSLVLVVVVNALESPVTLNVEVVGVSTLNSEAAASALVLPATPNAEVVGVVVMSAPVSEPVTVLVSPS